MPVPVVCEHELILPAVALLLLVLLLIRIVVAVVVCMLS